MMPHSAMMLGAADTQPARFIAAFGDIGATAALDSYGVQAGDLLLARTSGNAITGGGAGSWSGLAHEFYWRLVADPAATVSIGGSIRVDVAAYRGPKSLVARASGYEATNDGLPRSLAGFTAAANHAGLLAIQKTRYAASSSDVTGPATWTRRIAQSQGSGAAGEDNESYDRLYPANAPYADGASFTWYPASVGQDAFLTILELLNL